MNIALACYIGLLGHHLFEVIEVESSIIILIDFGDKVAPVNLIELIIRYLESLLEMVKSDDSATVRIEKIESPSQL